MRKFTLAVLNSREYKGVRINLTDMSRSVRLKELPNDRGELSMVGFVNDDGNFVLIEEDLGHGGIYGYVHSDVDLLALSKTMNPMVGHSSYSPFVDVTKYLGNGWYRCNYNLD